MSLYHVYINCKNPLKTPHCSEGRISWSHMKAWAVSCFSIMSWYFSLELSTQNYNQRMSSLCRNAAESTLTTALLTLVSEMDFQSSLGSLSRVNSQFMFTHNPVDAMLRGSEGPELYLRSSTKMETARTRRVAARETATSITPPVAPDSPFPGAGQSGRGRRAAHLNMCRCRKQ